MIKLLSRLPWAALYAFSAFLYFLAYYVVRHREHVIREQIQKVFPALSSTEREAMHKQFLRNFCDVAVELLKSVSTTSEDPSHRPNHAASAKKVRQQFLGRHHSCAEARPQLEHQALRPGIVQGLVGRIHRVA